MRFGMPWPGRDVGREAEQAGAEAFCAGEFADHDSYLTVADIVANTERATAGPAIAYAFARTPYAHATALRHLHSQAPGRLFLGLGSAAFRINRDWLGVPAEQPVARIAETVGAVRAWLHAENGERVRYAGEFYDLDADVRAPVLGRLDIPVLLAAFNSRMAVTAGRVADGVIGHGLFTDSWWNEVVRPAVARGDDEHDPAGTHPLEHGWIITAVDDNAPERAIADARRMIAFYLTVRTYDPFVAHHGWEEPVARLRDAFRAGDTDAMARAVTDEMLTEIAVCGTTADAKDTLARRAAALPRDIGYFAPPSFMVSRGRRAAYARAGLALIGALPDAV
ncbi:LLM class flavin-dependent oxidoreductase [Streptomyces sp. NBC_00365]|uniref:LLM class flavin-dependent oxidoreductase n=1 Tax=Streptomyces sp. NBC_00365 TaxID=2975726 RepID=UPI002258BEE2|nr:LLM class flavin-dependent oxidoreductase [Streptomyces sp. NBC_00365]MCX5096114.1 LLM class flavin-dependent oxidoreductase [Streptomyces sp. NBC_00365]